MFHLYHPKDILSIAEYDLYNPPPCLEEEVHRLYEALFVSTLVCVIN